MTLPDWAAHVCLDILRPDLGEDETLPPTRGSGVSDRRSGQRRPALGCKP